MSDAKRPRVRPSRLRNRPTALRFGGQQANKTSVEKRERDRQIVQLYQDGGVTQAQLGERFGLTQSGISGIVWRERRRRGEP